MEEDQELSNQVGIIDNGEVIAIGTQVEITRQVGEMETLILQIDESEDIEKLVAAKRNVVGVIKADRCDHAVWIIEPTAVASA